MLCLLLALPLLPACLYRYYPLFGLMANVALIFSGQYVKYVSGLRSGLPVGRCPPLSSALRLRWCMCMCIFSAAYSVASRASLVRK
jgi:ATP/ADP translocase